MNALNIPIEYANYTSFRANVRKALLANTGRAVFKLQIVDIKRSFKTSPKRVTLTTIDYSGGAVEFSIFGPIVFSDEVKALTIGSEVCVEGVPSEWNGSIQLKNIALIDAALLGKIVPIYKSKKGQRGATLKEVQADLEQNINEIVQSILNAYALTEAQILRAIETPHPSLAKLLHALHLPSSLQEGLDARRDALRLAALHLGAQAFSKNREANPKSIIPINLDDVEQLIRQRPYPLTDDQRTAIMDIVGDLMSPVPASRLLSGDTGYGKSVSFVIPAVAACRAGARVAIMAPNEPLVQQIGRDIAKSAPDVIVQAVTGRTRKLNFEGNPILVGTTALLHRLTDKSQWEPDFLIVDEQHKQSIKARTGLLSPHTNLLEATATAIPRTTALAYYGHMDVSILKQCPVKKCITTHIVGPQERHRTMDYLKRVVEAGRQIAIVYPKVSTDDEQSQRKSVMTALEQWNKWLPGEVAYVHGKMSDTEKLKTIEDFMNRRFKALLATVLIEIGIDFQISAMLVVGPDRLGVAQLHQLRGRIARNGGSGRFLMYLENSEAQPDVLNRLNLLVEHSDGFVLAEKDAELRGFGDLSEDADAQHGDSKGLFQGVRLSPADVIQGIEQYKRIKSL